MYLFSVCPLYYGIISYEALTNTRSCPLPPPLPARAAAHQRPLLSRRHRCGVPHRQQLCWRQAASRSSARFCLAAPCLRSSASAPALELPPPLRSTAPAAVMLAASCQPEQRPHLLCLAALLLRQSGYCYGKRQQRRLPPMLKGARAP